MEIFQEAAVICGKIGLALLGIAVLIMFAVAAVDVYKNNEYCTPGEHCDTCPYDCKGEKDRIV